MVLGQLAGGFQGVPGLLGIPPGLFPCLIALHLTIHAEYLPESFHARSLQELTDEAFFPLRFGEWLSTFLTARRLATSIGVVGKTPVELGTFYISCTMHVGNIYKHLTHEGKCG